MSSSDDGRRHMENRAVDIEAGRVAEELGRAVPPTVEGFRLAILREGHDAVARGLISRHNRRFQRLGQIASTMQIACLPTFTGYIEFDVALRAMGADHRPNVSYGKSWIDQLGWGLDSVAASARFLMCMQVIGASIVARSQLERWSTNLAANISLSQYPGEDTAAWMGRIWNYPGAQRVFFWHEADGANRFVIRAIDRHIDSQRLFAELSELLHGRGPLVGAVWWETVDFESELQAEHVQLVDSVCDALTLCVSQIQSGLACSAHDLGYDLMCAELGTTPIVGPISGYVEPLLPYIWPIELCLLDDEERFVNITTPGLRYQAEVGKAVHGEMPDFPHEIAPALAFAERRSRAYILARAALCAERQYLGAEFDERRMGDITVESILASEMAGLLARWARDRGDADVATAFVLCASSLRSGVWLWLEDDYRAMGCLRVVLEQLARIRTWRLKPAVAVKLEARTQTTPRDWIDKSGWKRLRVLLGALGEFAHGAYPSHWNLAHDVLIELNPGDDQYLVERTGRTNTLRNLINLLQGECAEWLELTDPIVAEAYWKVIRLSPEKVARGMEYVLHRAWLNKDMPTRDATWSQSRSTTDGP